MPATRPPADAYLANLLAQFKQELAALKAQQTTYVPNPAGEAQAIIGNLEHDQAGNPTGLTGFGIAVKTATGGWLAVGPATTAASAARAGSLSVPKTTWTSIKVDTLEAGNASLFDLTHGYYVTPAKGVYQVSGVVALLKESAEEGIVIPSIWGTAPGGGAGELLRGTRVVEKAGDEGVNAVVTGLIELAAGTQIELRAYHTFATERPLELSGIENRLSAHRVG